MRWTKQKPLLDGYYWYRDDRGSPAHIVYCEPSEEYTSFKFFRDFGYDMAEFNGEWAGPIELPEE